MEQKENVSMIFYFFEIREQLCPVFGLSIIGYHIIFICNSNQLVI